MRKCFNVTGACYPDENYMVDIEKRLCEIKALVDEGKYFVMNRARQYGKTTVLWALQQYLQPEYVPVLLSFQKLSTADFESEYAFTAAFADIFVQAVKGKKITELDRESVAGLEAIAEEKNMHAGLRKLFKILGNLCGGTAKPLVLMIDEVDNASNNQVFLDFLAMLRDFYLDRKSYPVFQSVILAGVYDIKNLKLKIRPEGEHKYNSPWNIAADFSVDMSFSVEDIAGMLEAYEHDHQTGMEIEKTAGNIYEYTSGYPYLVSGICKLMDEQVGRQKGFDAGLAWSAAGVREAVRIFLKEPNTLFDDMIKKLTDYEELCLIIKGILFSGQTFAFNPYNYAINVGRMLGFIKESNEVAVVANRIFEMHLYNYFLSEEMTKSVTYKSALQEKNQFVAGKDLDMDKVLQKFGEHYSEIYSDNDVKFLEENGRRLFLLYLKPIINGSGNYYVEARTRDMNRTDVVIDYCGKQYIVEMKIHRGEAYERKGIEQLAGYLEEYHLSKGYMLVFNFNKHKKAEMKTVKCNGKEIMEVVV
ncbi:MAG: ATP-binding protein [Lachnospiraceae bacterium]|nr:ATP-binding protein [Lachnospiraceae bacterium]